MAATLIPRCSCFWMTTVVSVVFQQAYSDTRSKHFDFSEFWNVRPRCRLDEEFGKSSFHIAANVKKIVTHYTGPLHTHISYSWHESVCEVFYEKDSRSHCQQMLSVFEERTTLIHKRRITVQSHINLFLINHHLDLKPLKLKQSLINDLLYLVIFFYTWL